jgi:hypothetical protein
MDTLDTQKLRIELAKIDRSHAWLARKLGFSRQYMGWLTKTESVKYVDEMAEALNMYRSDLIK